MTQRMLVIWSLGPLPFLNPAWTSGSSRFTYYWSLAWRILRITLLLCEISATVRYFEHSLVLPFLGLEWKLTFSSPVATTEFSKFFDILNAALSQHHLLGFEIAQLEFHHLHYDSGSRMKSESEVVQSCLTICGPMDCSHPGSSIHGIFQARILEWVAISFSKGCSWPRNQTQVSRTAGRLFTIWAT